MNAPHAAPVSSNNIRRLAQMELTGAGQVYVQGNYAYVGHLTNKERLGTSILDISDPRKPRIVSQITLDDPSSHSHKARVVGDIMIVNNEMNASALGRKSEVMATSRRDLEQVLGRVPTPQELADKLSVSVADLAVMEQNERNPYNQGGFKLYDVSDKTKPKLISFVKTGGRGVHRYDMDENYAYISTEMEGYLGAMLVIYDIRNPSKVEEVSRWWMPGQHTAGGEKPTWPGRRNRPAPRAQIGRPSVGGMLDGRCAHHRCVRYSQAAHGGRVQLSSAVRRADAYLQRDADQDRRSAHRSGDRRRRPRAWADEMAKRRGRPHAALWVFDVTDFSNIKPLSVYEVSELDSPWSRATPDASAGINSSSACAKRRSSTALGSRAGCASSISRSRTRRRKSRTSFRSLRADAPDRRRTMSTWIIAAFFTSSIAARASISSSSTAAEREDGSWIESRMTDKARHSGRAGARSRIHFRNRHGLNSLTCARR
jgi:hypothetical protein